MQPRMTATSSVDFAIDAINSLNRWGFNFLMPESAYDLPCGLPITYNFSKAFRAIDSGCANISLKSISPLEVTPANPTPPNANLSTLDRRSTAAVTESSAKAVLAAQKKTNIANHLIDCEKRISRTI